MRQATVLTMQIAVLGAVVCAGVFICLFSANTQLRLMSAEASSVFLMLLIGLIAHYYHPRR